MKFIIGKKIEMTQVWRGDKVIAVTKVEAGPCTVTQVKKDKSDGYEAVQIGFGSRKPKNIKKPQKGHLKDLGNFWRLREFRVETDSLKTGDRFDASSFQEGDKIKVTGISKGKGFQGVVKRHGFKGAKTTHGTKDQVRMPGSIGATGPAHVFKGTRMGGRMGGDRVTVSNLEVVEVDKLKNIIYIKGAVPGARNGLIMILGDGQLELIKSREKPAEAGKDDMKESPAEAKKKSVSKEKKEENIEKVVEEAKQKIDKEQTGDKKENK